MNIQLKYLFLIISFMPILLIGQNDTIKPIVQKITNKFSKNRCVDPKENYEKNGYDSLNRKQGLWTETENDYVLFFPDSNYFISDLEVIGFYVNDKKEGFWDLFKVDEMKNKELIGQVFYQNDSAIHQVTYSNSKISQFSRIGYKKRLSNEGATNIMYCTDQIVFDNNGSLIYRASYSPDGLYEKRKYQAPTFNKNKKQKK